MGVRLRGARDGVALARFARKPAVRNCLRAVVFAGAFGAAWLIGASAASAEDGTGPPVDDTWSSEPGWEQAWQDEIGSSAELTPWSCADNAGGHDDLRYGPAAGSGEAAADDRLAPYLSAHGFSAGQPDLNWRHVTGLSSITGLGLLDLPFGAADERGTADPSGLTTIVCSVRPVTGEVTAALADVPAVLTQTASDAGVSPVLAEVPDSLGAIVLAKGPSSGRRAVSPRPPSVTHPAQAAPPALPSLDDDHFAPYVDASVRADSGRGERRTPAPERRPAPLPLFGVTGWGLTSGTASGGPHPLSGDGLVGSLPTSRFPEPPSASPAISTECGTATGIPAAEPPVSPD